VFLLDPNSGVPLYVQLQQQIRKRILSGRLPHRTQLPSVRDLSAELHINPLTVAKVYQLLERDGFVQTRRGIGTYVAHQSPALRIDARRLQIDACVEQLVVEALHLGLSEREVKTLLIEKFRQLIPKEKDYEHSHSPQDVTRSFSRVDVVNGLSFSVKRGSIYGFLGRNGSGKTTTLRMLAGLIRPTIGTVRILGHDPFTMGAQERQALGYMSEKAIIPPMVKVKTVLRLGRDLYPQWDAGLADSLIGKYGISPAARFSTLSQGQQRLVGFILAIAPRPQVLLLDEPAANLDVVARREILDDILDLVRDGGCTVLFSTHILSDVERVADEIGILAQGALKVSEPLDELKESIQQVRFYDFEDGMPRVAIPESYRTVLSGNEIVATVKTTSHPEAWAERWSCQYETRALNLEDIFVELSRHHQEIE
jgi:ABC-2 type transport system ATP-binding protein